MVAQSSSRARQRATRRMVFSFAKHSSIWIQVGAVLREKTERRADGLDDGAHRRTPMHRHPARRHRRGAASVRALVRCRRGSSRHRSDRRRRRGPVRPVTRRAARTVVVWPAAVGGVVDHALAPLPTPVAANQVGPHATFIQKHEPRGLAARRDLTRLAPPLLQAVDHATEHARPDVAEARAAWQQTAPTWDPDARLTAYFSAISFDAMPASLSLSTRVRKSREYAAISALLPQEYHDRVLSTSEIRASIGTLRGHTTSGLALYRSHTSVCG